MEKKLINIGKASERLDIPRSTLRCWCSRKLIPYVKIGRMVRFDVAVLDQWIEERSIKPTGFDGLPGLE